jgi:hypothetical protein
MLDKGVIMPVKKIDLCKICRRRGHCFFETNKLICSYIAEAQLSRKG